MWTAPASAPGSTLALQATGLSRRFGRRWAVTGVDLSLAPGAGLLVAGRNGSGKSTLLRLLAGALRADRGEIRVQGRSDRTARLARCALLGHAAGTYEPLTALENLALFSRLLGKPADRRSLASRLDEVGLSSQADVPIQAFSAGMHQRLALARLLLQVPAVALLDEPHSALDPDGARLVDELIARMRRAGVAVVLASHHLPRAAALCDRALLLERGRIQWSGPASELARRLAEAAPSCDEGAL